MSVNSGQPILCNVTKDSYLSCAGPGIVAVLEFSPRWQEVALVSGDLGTCCPGGSAGYGRLAAGPARRDGGREGVADDLRLACGLGRAAD